METVAIVAMIAFFAGFVVVGIEVGRLRKKNEAHGNLIDKLIESEPKMWNKIDAQFYDYERRILKLEGAINSEEKPSLLRRFKEEAKQWAKRQKQNDPT